MRKEKKYFLGDFKTLEDKLIIKTSDKEDGVKIIEEDCYETNTAGAVKKFFFNTEEAQIVDDQYSISARMWIKMDESGVDEHPFYRTGISVKTNNNIGVGKKLYVENGYVMNINPVGDIWLSSKESILGDYYMGFPPTEWIQYRLDVEPIKKDGIVVADKLIAFINKNLKEEKWEKVIETQIKIESALFLSWSNPFNKYICGIEQHGRSAGEPVKVLHKKFEIYKL